MLSLVETRGGVRVRVRGHVSIEIEFCIYEWIFQDYFEEDIEQLGKVRLIIY